MSRVVPSSPDEVPALQAERTSLSWQRTALGVVGIAALLAHSGPTVGWAVTLVLGVALLVVAEGRLRRVTSGIGRGSLPPARGLALALTTGVLVVAGAGVATVLMG